MTIYAVMVRHDLGQRWIDSLWVRKYSWENGAEKRMSQLQSTFKSFGCDSKFTVWMSEMELEDGSLHAPTQSDSSDEREDARAADSEGR